jgi:hypothetical protein
VDPRPDPARRPYLGYRADDHDTNFAKYFKEKMAPLRPDIVDALALGPQSPAIFRGLDDAPALLDEESGEAETGYAFGRDGSMRLHVYTPMPDVTAEMWDWWFGWHGEDTRRYKLWHPQAHLYAEWAESSTPAEARGRARYVGRTSFIDEYLGSRLLQGAIRFVPAWDLGFDSERLVEGGPETAVCARVGSSRGPVDAGWLIHHVRAAADGGRGAEMRSRFWLGGHYAGVRGSGPAATALGAALKLVVRPTAQMAADLLVHCSREMAHLASFLPALHAEFGDS